GQTFYPSEVGLERPLHQARRGPCARAKHGRALERRGQRVLLAVTDGNDARQGLKKLAHPSHGSDALSPLAAPTEDQRGTELFHIAGVNSLQSRRQKSL